MKLSSFIMMPLSIQIMSYLFLRIFSFICLFAPHRSGNDIGNPHWNNLLQLRYHKLNGTAVVSTWSTSPNVCKILLRCRHVLLSPNPENPPIYKMCNLRSISISIYLFNIKFLSFRKFSVPIRRDIILARFVPDGNTCIFISDNSCLAF